MRGCQKSASEIGATASFQLSNSKNLFPCVSLVGFTLVVSAGFTFTLHMRSYTGQKWQGRLRSSIIISYLVLVYDSVWRREHNVERQSIPKVVGVVRDVDAVTPALKSSIWFSRSEKTTQMKFSYSVIT